MKVPAGRSHPGVNHGRLLHQIYATKNVFFVTTGTLILLRICCILQHAERPLLGTTQSPGNDC
jgi:hypothetical protein